MISRAGPWPWLAEGLDLFHHSNAGGLTKCFNVLALCLDRVRITQKTQHVIYIA